VIDHATRHLMELARSRAREEVGADDQSSGHKRLRSEMDTMHQTMHQTSTLPQPGVSPRHPHTGVPDVLSQLSHSLALFSPNIFPTSGSTSAAESAPRVPPASFMLPSALGAGAAEVPTGLTNKATTADTASGDQENRTTGNKSAKSYVRRCAHPSGCKKGRAGKTLYCKAHGGGKRCTFPSCTTAARGGGTLCQAHGGGKRCQYPGCQKGAESPTDRCKAHGGGRRCTHPAGCRSSATGPDSLCRRHGGGRRCLHESMSGRAALAATNLCLVHGGGKPCTHAGCTKHAARTNGLCEKHAKVEGCAKT
jgi:hypothetical protein